MRISGQQESSMQTGQIGMGQAKDAVSKNIQRQIGQVQKQLQELSSNEEMSVEDKMKRRQELQKQIADLNNQLRTHEMEVRKEKQQTKGNSMDDLLGGGSQSRAAKAGDGGKGLSQASMKAMISADSAIGQADVQGSVAKKMEGRAGVLETEIKLDAARGGDTAAKEEQLAKAQQKALSASASQMSTLGQAREEIQEAAKDDEDKNVNAGQTKDDKTEKTADTKDQPVQPEDGASSDAAAVTATPVDYTPVDVRI